MAKRYGQIPLLILIGMLAQYGIMAWGQEPDTLTFYWDDPTTGGEVLWWEVDWYLSEPDGSNLVIATYENVDRNANTEGFQVPYMRGKKANLRVKGINFSVDGPDTTFNDGVYSELSTDWIDYGGPPGQPGRPTGTLTQ